MPRTSFQHKYKNIQRLRQISNILFKHGLGYIVGKLGLFPLLSWGKKFVIWRRKEEEFTQKSVAARTRLVLEELGPSFVKFGQMISSRPDLVPEAFSEEFKKLQDNVAPFSFTEVRQVIETQFEAPLEQLYAEVDPIPTAAASIAQVHSATLHDGQKVVLKVQRPGIREVIERDMELLFYFANLLEKQIPEVRIYRPVAVAEEVARSIRRETDFQLEANNCQRLKDNFGEDPTVHVPQVYWDLTGRTVITMEKVDGIPVDEIEKLEATGYDLKQIADNGCDAFLKQIFEHGFFHADPHPGNILVGENNCVILLDFGIMGHLDDHHMSHIANVMFALTDRDYDRLVHEYLMLGFATGETNIEDFKRDIVDFFEPYYGQSLKNIPIGIAFSQAMTIMARHKIQTPVDLMLLAKTFIFVESIGRQLDPDFNMLEFVRPYAASLLKKRMHPKRLANIVSKNISEFGDLFKQMPRQTQLLLRKLLLGELEIGYVHSGLEPLITERRRSNKELSTALVVTSLIIAAAIIIHSGKDLVVLGIPLSLACLGLAAFFGTLMVFSMFRT